METKRYMTTNEIAAYIGVSKFMIYDLIKNRKIPFVPIGDTGLRKRFDVKAIDAWMEKKSVKAGPL